MSGAFQNTGFQTSGFQTDVQVSSAGHGRKKRRRELSDEDWAAFGRWKEELYARKTVPPKQEKIIRRTIAAYDIPLELAPAFDTGRALAASLQMIMDYFEGERIEEEAAEMLLLH